MPEPLHFSEHAWKEAEALVARIERSAAAGGPQPGFFDDLAGGLRLTTAASAVAVWVCDRETYTVLSRSGIAVHDEATPMVDRLQDDSCASDWSSLSSDPSQLPDRLRTLQPVADQMCLGMDLQFDRPVEFRLQQHLTELAEVVADIAVKVYLRRRVSELRERVDLQTGRDDWFRLLYSGNGLVESFQAVAAAVASVSHVDRVSVLQRRDTQYRMLASSSGSKIDRRARQVRLLERLSQSATSTADRAHLTAAKDREPVVGDPESDQPIAELADEYFAESNCRELYIETISSPEQKQPIAALVLERFREAGEAVDPESVLTSIRVPVTDAVVLAIQRDSSWGLVNRLASRSFLGRNWATVLVFAGLVLVACCVPTALTVPAEGRLLSSNRSRLFSPVEGTVAEIAVGHGQKVRAGQTLISLRSAELDLQQSGLESALATARTRLGSLGALRSRGGASAGRFATANVAADEKSLRTEIEGLETQLGLLRKQRKSLNVTSPMDGSVDRWDLRESLQSRPVTHGQHLLDVISHDSGWTVELEVAEKDINYVLSQLSEGTVDASLRLRSNPEQTFYGGVHKVSGVAHFDALGRSVVRVVIPLDPHSSDGFREGASVVARLNCGRRPLGWVWFRGVVQWWRTQSWI